LADFETKTEVEVAKVDLTLCQEKALVMLNGADNVFLTGVAGSGKSFLIQHFLKGKNPKSNPIVASTGAAAVLVHGVTFHSFFSLGIMEGGLEKTIERALKDKRLKKRLRATNVLVIDEISMISGKALQAAENISRLVREKQIPWGGVKVIAVGDFGQLPPVNSYGNEKDWAFLSEAWRKSSFRVAFLQTVMRSKDLEFLEVLNLIRDGYVTDKVTRFLNLRVKDLGEKFDGTLLFPHRQSVEEYNLKELEGLSGKTYSFKTEYNGSQKYLEQIKKTAPIPEILKLKLNALVMLRKNDPNKEYVNGSLGHLKSVESNRLTISLLNGNCVSLEPESFSCLNAEGEEVAAATNFPVNLAWASTIHKSQGMTLDVAAMDLSRVFEAGQAYVALSRVRSSEGLFLKAWNPSAIRASKEVKIFHDEIFNNPLL
jgi:ATP-dependent DNA helicase PIF1